MNVTGIPMWRADDFLDQEVATFIPRPYDPAMDQDRRSPFPGCIGECARRKGRHLRRHDRRADPRQRGMIVPPDWYFREMKAMLEEHGILLIADEIQTVAAARDACSRSSITASYPIFLPWRRH